MTRSIGTAEILTRTSVDINHLILADLATAAHLSTSALMAAPFRRQRKRSLPSLDRLVGRRASRRVTPSASPPTRPKLRRCVLDQNLALNAGALCSTDHYTAVLSLIQIVLAN